MFLTCFTSLSVLLPFPLSITFFVFMHGFYSISSNIDEVLSINPSANVFVFGETNIHYKDWPTYSGGTDRPGQLRYNFCISNDLTQMVNFPTWILDCDSNSPALLNLFLSSDISICSTMTFPPLGNSDHVVLSASMDFSSNSKRDAPFYCKAYDYFCADWDGLQDHLRKISLSSVLLLLQAGIDAYIPYRKYHIKSHPSPWFSAAYAAAIVHRNHFFSFGPTE